ncbi:MAG: tRNA preQ1(34) S-adenosylmethionine ribosyltransferase-isomerase QueA [Thermodesulfobacteriota bacterium]
MKSEDFDYDLPKNLIAFYPEDKRDESKLLVLNKKEGTITHKKFFNITDFLVPGDLLVLNNTKVIPAKLICEKDGKETELLLTKRLCSDKWKVLISKPKPDAIIKFKEDLTGSLQKNSQNEWIIIFDREADEYIENFGKMPLPPYIERESEDKDKSTYQTVYAKKDGAIAAPTAGLHFTQELIEQIRNQCVDIKYITLHVSIGTFRPVTTEKISDHVMHKEFVEIPEDTASAVNFAKKSSRRVVAGGTTVVRALETAVDGTGRLNTFSDFTDLFIYPPYDYKIVDSMITNFHLPKSTLLMLVAAFCGEDLTFETYKTAIHKNYRFLSYGDAMFVY